MAKKKTTEQWIEDAKKVHGDEYDYSKSVYNGKEELVEIFCKKHNGYFWQQAGVHLRGFGCSECSGTKKITQEEFLKRCHDIHGNKYDYSKSIIINSNTIIEVICAKEDHGSFFPTPSAHIFHKSGCPKCAGVRKLTKEEFVKKSINVHGNIYNYDNLIYTTLKDKMEIICLVDNHGSFWQTGTNHLNNDGCPKCFGKFLWTTEMFINKAKEIFGDKYDYSKTEYINQTTNVIVNCPLPNHGDFKTNPRNHIHSYSGCPECGKTQKNEKIVRKFINDFKFKNERLVIQGNEFKCYPDFYLPQLNLIIEYNGNQHYEPVTFGSQTKEESQIAFIKQQKRDEFVRQYCADNNINLWEIDGRKYRNKKLAKLLEDKFLKFQTINFMGKGVI